MKKFKEKITSLLMRFRNVVGTLFTNERPHEQFITSPLIKYFIGQYEICPSSKRRHLQFYCEFVGQQRLGAVRQLFGPTVHVEPRRGTVDEARTYCSKEDTREPGIDSGPFENGTPSKSGKRSDLADIKEELDAGSSLKSISQQHFGQFLRYRKSFEAYIVLNQDPRTWEMENSILWGEPGTGKTKLAYDLKERDGVEGYPLMRNQNGNVWFDGYHGQEILLIDDYYGWIPLAFLLQLLDRYPMNVQTKGGSVPFTSKKIIITSNKSPECWYNWSKFGKNMFGAFERRINQVFHYVKDKDPAIYPIKFPETVSAVEFFQ
ncbi:replication-associated protein [Avon-Heathcote Estuary associated circular virus 7]|uniref:replication-associated protein n=1 Tax=Avon-Heathcote Estuary associated circular virus 7 TaxID=1618258 RepID=UPI0005CCB3A9|nr:replication-associated protein [Avon-Heathcote Estuary associated circular virus 7]AJP36369.1 replication-associated protein [Avon-Heathcote Estuary associated circular virus 7]